MSNKLLSHRPYIVVNTENQTAIRFYLRYLVQRVEGSRVQSLLKIVGYIASQVQNLELLLAYRKLAEWLCTYGLIEFIHYLLERCVLLEGIISQTRTLVTTQFLQSLDLTVLLLQI